MKNSSDTIGNRTRDIPACSTVPQPTAPPRTLYRVEFLNLRCHLKKEAEFPELLNLKKPEKMGNIQNTGKNISLSSGK
jgi:hypothetical protein